MVIAAFSRMITFIIIANIYFLATVVAPPTVPQKMEEIPGAEEGDMLFPPQRSRALASRGTSARWPNGIVPYEILPGYPAEQEAFIVGALRRLETAVAINNVRCVQFRPKVASDQYFISIFNGIGCSSYVGQNTGVAMVRTVTLQYPGCIDDGRIMHEMLHTLGFFHEQSRPDRDSYVKINWQNIQNGTENNFASYPNTAVDTQNQPYDYSSVMHYERNAFSKNGLPTIEPLQSNAVIGQRISISTIDIREVQLYYNCSATGVTLPPPTTTSMTTTTTTYTQTSLYSSALTSNNQKYSRSAGLLPNYYYEAIRVTVSTAGSYSFQSNSGFNSYGYLYSSSFDPSNVLLNLLGQDDDAGGSAQFKITYNLQPGNTYVLVATTFSQVVMGVFTIIATGPGRVTFTQMSTPATTTATTTVTTRPVTNAASFRICPNAFWTQTGTIVASSSNPYAWRDFDLDGNDNVYVVDYQWNNNRIFKYMAGNPTDYTVMGISGQNSNDYITESMTVDKYGNIYSCEVKRNPSNDISTSVYRIQKYVAGGSTSGSMLFGESKCNPVSGQQCFACGKFAVDNLGFLYVPQSHNGRVLKITPYISTPAVVATPGGNPISVSVDKDGTLFVALASTNQVVKYTSGSQTALVLFTMNAAYPITGMTVDISGNIYVYGRFPTGGYHLQRWVPGSGNSFTNVQVGTNSLMYRLRVDSRGNFYSLQNNAYVSRHNINNNIC